MTRYFDTYYNSEPMEELTEEQARAKGSYVIEDDLTLRRFRRIFRNELESIVYAGWDDPATPLADLARLAAGVRGEVHSPVEYGADGEHGWRTWYIDPGGQVTKILEPWFAADGAFLRRALRRPDGELISNTIYHYDRDGYLLELVTHAPDGTIMARQDA